MADKRVIDLTEKSTVDNSDYLIVDNATGGTKKLQLGTLIGSLDGIKKAVVQTLPTQDIDTNTIYLVPKQTAGTQNVYDEYMYINNAWELIGDTEVDLSDYQTKIDNNLNTTSKEIVGAINELQSSSGGSPTLIASVTADGVKTNSELLLELFQALPNEFITDITSINIRNSFLISSTPNSPAGGTLYRFNDILWGSRFSGLIFTRTSVISNYQFTYKISPASDLTNSRYDYFKITADSTPSVTLEDRRNTVPTSGTKYAIYL